MIERLVVFDNQVPFIDKNANAFVLFENHACDMGILGRDTFFGVDEQQCNISALNRTQGAQHTVFFDPRFDAATAAHARSID